MPIEERLMAAGKWNIGLDPSTPKAIRDVLDYFGHCYVFDASRIRPGLSDTTMIALSRWGGILRRRKTPWDIAGTNMICWLGDEDGKGPIIESKIGGAGTPSTLNNYVVNALVGPGNVAPAVTAGNVVAGGTTHDPGYQWITVRAALDSAALIWGAEYRVNKDFSIDVQLVGATPSLTPRWFAQTPTAIAMRRNSGRDISIAGLSMTQLDVSVDAEEYFVRAIVHDGTGAYTASAGSATPYKDGQGNLIKMAKIFEQSNTPNAVAAAVGASLVSAGEILRYEITQASDQFDIDRDVIVGDYIYVYDHDAAVVDITKQVRYRGSIIYPMKHRVMAMTWPIERGMSVWYRSGAAVWTDLTDYVVWESPGVTFEVGAPVRPLTKS